MHDGAVTASSREGEGAVFIITLPVKHIAKPVAVL